MIIEDVKVRLNNLVNQLTAVHGYLQLNEHTKAKDHLKEALKELRRLIKAIDLLANHKKDKD